MSSAVFKKASSQAVELRVGLRATRRCFTTRQDRIEGARRGMQRWVDEFIVQENLCPFAETSSYQIQVFPQDHFSVKTLSFFRRCVLNTGANIDNTPRLNTFVVFPFLPEFHNTDQDSVTSGSIHFGTEMFLRFYAAAVQECDGLALTPEMEINKIHQDHPKREQQVICMPFHPNLPEWKIHQAETDGESPSAAEVSEEIFYTACAPFPAIHLLRREDMLSAQMDYSQMIPNTSGGKRVSVSQSIMDDNRIKLPKIGMSVLEERFQDYKSELPPKDEEEEDAEEEFDDISTPTKLPRSSVIQVLEQPSPERLKELENQGIKVEVMQVAESKLTETAKPISFGKKLKKGKKGKKR